MVTASSTWLASQKLLLFKGAGNGTFTQAASIKVGTQNALAQVRTGDFNGDGKADLTISDYYDIYVLFNTGNFTFKTVKVADARDGIFAAPADVNQDGIADLLVSYYTCSTIKSVSCPNWDGVFLNATPRATCTPSTVSPSVTVCEPQNLIYSHSPVQWIADSRDTSPSVTAMQIYVDNELVVNSPAVRSTDRCLCRKDHTSW